uniref:B30.2/SPRY domain-containing protein n=1 Tax=Pygocentrus nattereri TaxID=42514 RepID=A0AAR2J061_PYGNA
DLILPCSLQPNISAVGMTVEWLRLDQADSTVHLYTDHEDISKEQAVSYKGRTALFKEELLKGNTSLKLSDIQIYDEGTYKCLVKSENCTHTLGVSEHTCPEWWAAQFAAPGEQLGVRCLAKGHLMDVTMDIETAHPYLNLSDGGKQVIYGKKREDYCDGECSFDDFVFVLGNEGFEKAFYFEVQVRGKTHWTLGVAKKTVRKKGEIILKPEFGFWTVSKKNNVYSPRASIFLRHKPKKVGVFVRYDEGVVSFYDVDAKSKIYSYTDQSFSEKLYPIFSPDFKRGGKNAAPLIITPVHNTHPHQTDTNRFPLSPCLRVQQKSSFQSDKVTSLKLKVCMLAG